VAKLADLSESAHIERELMMVKVKTTAEQREEVKRCADIFRGQIIDITASTYTIQVVGTSDKLEAFIEALNGTQILETVRSGVSGISRGERTLSL
jgi:acetolactate synthase-1/3 small subunit